VGRTEQGWNLSHHAVTRHQAFKQAHAHVGLDPDGTEPGWSVTGEDGLAYLRSLPSESVDLFITDPPYESLERHRAVGTTTRLKVSKASSNPWFPVVSNSYLGEAITEMYRVLRPARHAYVFCDDETSLVVRTFAEQVGFYWWKSLTWLKVRGSEPKRDGKSAIDIVLDNLEKDHDFLLKGDVFTPDLIETWIEYKREKEVDPMRLRPHPYEFFLYYDV